MFIIFDLFEVWSSNNHLIWSSTLHVGYPPVTRCRSAHLPAAPTVPTAIGPPSPPGRFRAPSPGNFEPSLRVETKITGWWLVVLGMLKNMKVNGKDYHIYYGKSRNKWNHQAGYNKIAFFIRPGTRLPSKIIQEAVPGFRWLKNNIERGYNKYFLKWKMKNLNWG